MIFSFPFMLPIKAAQPEPIGITLATGLPRFVITMPSALRSSSKLRHCSLNFEALIRRIVPSHAAVSPNPGRPGSTSFPFSPTTPRNGSFEISRFPSRSA